jgi:dipeptidyl-peptidase-3
MRLISNVHGWLLFLHGECDKLVSLALAVCDSIVFEAANLPNVSSRPLTSTNSLINPQYDYIRETCGSKNIVLVANRLSVKFNKHHLPCPWIHPSELKFFQSTTHIVRSLTTAIHELIGHGTGKLLRETSPGTYNLDTQNPPVSPLDGEVVKSHYLPGQTWGSVFGKQPAGTVEECRAILTSKFLMDNKELLDILGYTDNSNFTA